MAPQPRLYISKDNSKRIYYPRKIKGKDKDVIPDGFIQQSFICPVTGDTWVNRGEFWDHIKVLKLTPGKMTYDRVATCENTDLMDKSHLEWLWNNYFETVGDINKLENLLGLINLELYIILLKVYNGDMDIDECLENVNSKKTGKDRDFKDQFYTNSLVSNRCIEEWIKHVNRKDIHVIEPSAGSGSFSDYFKENNYNIDSYDIDPKQDYIMKQDFLELDIKLYKDVKNVHTIGNPPFGRQSTLAKKFIKKCAVFSDSISFILPKSFRKESYQKSFPLNFHLVKELELDKNSFIIDGKPYNVPCVFQIWIKKNIDRYVEPKPIEKGFKFVKKPTIEIIEVNKDGYPNKKKNIFQEKPDFGILRAGGGDTCGRISKNFLDGIDCYPEAWLFIKLDEQYDKDEFYKKYQLIDWKDDSNVGARSIAKPTFIKGINQLIQSL